MKKIVTLAFAVALAFQLQAQAGRQSVIILQVFHGPDLSGSLAEQIRTTLVSKLMEQGGIEIIAQERVASAAAENGIDLGADDERAQLALAKFARADFILSPRAQKTAAKGGAVITVTVRLLSKDTGKDLFGKDASFAESALIRGMTDLAKHLGVAIRQRADLSLDQIDAFIRAKDWENALRWLELYASAKPSETAQLAGRKAQINIAMAAIRYADAQKAAELYLYAEAIRAAREASELDPKNDTYRLYLEAVQEEYAKFVSESVDQRLERVEKYVDGKKYDIASALLDRLKSAGPLTSRGQLLAERCTKGIAACERARAGETWLKAGRYGEALAAVDEALALLPDDPDYLRLRAAIMREEKRDAAGRERWSLYLQELRDYDYRKLFLSRKRPGAVLHVDVLASTIDAWDHSAATAADPDSWESAEYGPVLTIEGRYERPLPLKIPMPFSFTNVDACWYGALRLGGGVARGEKTDGLGNVSLVADTIVDTNLAAGASVRLMVLSYTLRLEADLGTGPFFFTRSSRDPFGGGGESVSDEFSWLFTASFGGSVSWMPTDSMHIGFQASKRFPMYAPAREMCDQPSSLSLGATVGFDL
ncbi:MAG: tetratricopeptide repeat protein [Spirochaetes bacterium]|nr:tetratricopeptide repeat protein [Spirochaetota bacterium]